jgi:hypothetical protein
MIRLSRRIKAYRKRRNPMTTDQARKIILHAVTTTKPRWSEYGVWWKDADRVFLMRAYEQGGFEVYKFIPLLDEEGIGTIPEIGQILGGQQNMRSTYDRSFAGSLDTPFWTEMALGGYGINGQRFERSVRKFLTESLGTPGRYMWRLLWYMLNSCAFLTCQHQGGFAVYVKAQLARYLGKSTVSDAELLRMSAEEWQMFVVKALPYKAIQGVGPNVFDFLMGDMADARFAKDCFKFDSSNKHFLTVTGISDLIAPFDRDSTIRFIRSLNLPFTLRETNQGIYTYSSETEAKNYGFCRSAAKCQFCGVKDLCMRRL